MEKALLGLRSTGGFGVTTVQNRTYLAVALLVLYALLDALTYRFPGPFGVTPLNPQAALALILLMFCGMKYVPLLLLAVFCGEYLVSTPGRPFALAVATSMVLTGGYAAAAHLLTSAFRVRPELGSLREVSRLILVALGTMLACGVGYVALLVLYGIGANDAADYVQGVRRFFIGYSGGMLIVVPLLLMLFSAQRRRQIAQYCRAPEAWILLLTAAALGAWMFVRDHDPHEHMHTFYLMFLPLMWAAVRFGMVGATVLLTLIQMGLFALFVLTRYQPMSVFELQLLLITLAVTALLLGAAIDEHRQIAADFRESLKFAAAGEMAAAIAHEINQPLTALSNYASAGQLIARSPQPDHAHLSDIMSKLMAETQRTAAVVRRLRDFFRTGATRLERVAMGDLAARVMQRARVRAEGHSIALDLTVQPDVPPVQADALQIEVVLSNLISNAIDSVAEAGMASGRVALNIRADAEGGVLVEVHDNGGGVRGADSERLFASFVTTKSQGMGMGLPICRAIVEAHGGRIWAVPGNTGLFCFTLLRQGAADSISH